jgi:hypothetical protein
VEGPFIPGLPALLRPVTSGQAWVDAKSGVVFALDAHQTLVAFDGHTGKERFRIADFSDSAATIGATGPWLYSAVSPIDAATDRRGPHTGWRMGNPEREVRVVLVEPATGHVQTCEVKLPVPPHANDLSVYARATESGLKLVWNFWDRVEGGPRREADPEASACGELPLDPSTCAVGEPSAKQFGPFPCMKFVGERAPIAGAPVDLLGRVKLKVDSKLEGPANCGGFTHYFLSGVSHRELWRRELAGEPTFCPIP